MSKKFLPILLFVLLPAGSAVAYNVFFEYFDKDYGTSFQTNVADNTTFVFTGKVDPNKGLTSFYYLKTPAQVKLKNYVLGIGIDKYASGNQVLNTCVNDARYVANQYNSYFNNSCILTNEFATKEAIRRGIADIACELGRGDNFLFYYSGCAGKNSGLCAYDADYTVSEFLDDLDKFHENVNIIIMLDAVGVKDFLSVLPNDFVKRSNVLIFAGSKTSNKKYSGVLSPFTYAWYKTKDYLTDVDKDQFLTFYEMACRIKLYLAKKKIKESFTFINENLAKKIIYCNSMCAEDYGDIKFNEDGSQFKITAPDIDHFAVIHTETYKRFVYDIAITPTKGSFNINLKKDSHPTKFFLDFDTGYLPQYSLSLTLNSVCIPILNRPKINKNGQSGTYIIEDYKYKPIGTLKFKKEGEIYRCKLKVTGMNELSKVLEASSGVEMVDLLLRFSEQLHQKKISFDKKYKPGKSISATLVN